MSNFSGIATDSWFDVAQVNSSNVFALLERHDFCVGTYITLYIMYLCESKWNEMVVISYSAPFCCTQPQRHFTFHSSHWTQSRLQGLSTLQLPSLPIAVCPFTPGSNESGRAIKGQIQRFAVQYWMPNSVSPEAIHPNSSHTHHGLTLSMLQNWYHHT